MICLMSGIAEKDGVRGLREDGDVSQPLEEYGDRGERERMLHHIAHTVAIMLDIVLRHLGRVVLMGFQGGDEVGVDLVHLRQGDGPFGASNRVAAERIGLDGRRLTLLEQEGGYPGIAIIEVDEFRLAGGNRHVVAEGAVSLCLDGIKVAVGIDLQLFDYDLPVGCTGQGALDMRLVGASSQRKRRKGEREELIAIFHIRRGLLRRSAPSVLS